MSEAGLLLLEYSVFLRQSILSWPINSEPGHMIGLGQWNLGRSDSNASSELMLQNAGQVSSDLL